MSRLIPSTTTLAKRPSSTPNISYTPIDDASMVLTDPSGVIASWSIAGGVLTVTTNAVVGSAFLLRPITPYPSDALFHCHVTAKRAGAQTATRVNVDWGVGGDPAVTVTEYIGVGVGIENDANIDRAHVSAAAANNWSGFVDQLLGVKGIISAPAPNGNSTSGTGAATAGGQLFSSEEASGWTRAVSSDVYKLEVEGIRINNEVGTAHTFSVELGYSYQKVSYA